MEQSARTQSSGSVGLSRADFVRAKAGWLLVAIGVFYVLYAACYIYRSSYVLEGERWFCLFDDAMISMRYARNWVDGHGLVWNPGERVEGYSNFLWTTVMAGVHLLRMPDRVNSLAVQVVCVIVGLGYITGTYRLGRAVRLSRAVSIGGALIAALYFPLTVWNLQGMEQGLLTGLLVWGCARCASSWQRGRFSKSGAILMAAALLTRIDAVVLVVGCWLLLSRQIERGRKAAFDTMSAALLILALYWIWRWMYYGSFWPNPYHLKLGIPLWYRLGVTGTFFMSSTVFRLNVLFVGSMVLALFGLKRDSRWDLLGVFLLSFAYMWWIGGDAWPFDRFICPAIPFAGLGLTHAYSRWLSAVRSSEQLHGSVGAGVIPACAAILVFSMNYVQVREWMQAEPYYAEANRTNIRRSVVIDNQTTEDARVAVFWAGAIPYFTHRYSIDVLGKSDPHIARKVAARLASEFPPGHNKFDLHYSIIEQRADVLDMPGRTIFPDLTQTEWFRKEFAPELFEIGGYQETLWFRKESPRRR